MRRLEYWAEVYRRAWKEAVATSPWSSPVRLLAAIAAVAATTAAGSLAHKGPIQITAWGLVAIAGVIVATFLFKAYWAVPADMAREAAAAQDVLKADLATFEVADPDASLHSAVAYVAVGEWLDDIFEAEGLTTHLETLAKTLDVLTERAFVGRIRLWGRINVNTRLKVIPADFWEQGRIDLTSMVGRPRPPAWTTSEPVKGGTSYIDLRVNKAEFEREWRAR